MHADSPRWPRTPRSARRRSAASSTASPGVSEAHAAGGADRARRARLRAADAAARASGRGWSGSSCPSCRTRSSRPSPRSSPTRSPAAASRRCCCTRTAAGVTEAGVRRHAARPARVGDHLLRRPVRTRPTPTTATTTACADRGLPVVLINAAYDDLGFPRVSADDAHAIEQAFAHLESLGPRADRHRARAAGPRAVDPQAATPTAAPDGDGRGRWSSARCSRWRAAWQRATRLIDRGATGVICASDVLALGRDPAGAGAPGWTCPATCRWSASTTRR